MATIDKNDGPADPDDMAATVTSRLEKVMSAIHHVESMMADRLAEMARESSTHLDRASAQIAQLTAANAALASQVAHITRQNREIALLGNMNDFLQNSANEKEAYAAISQAAEQLFPNDSGAVFVLSASRDVLEAAVAWGELRPANLVFLPSDCWAHRRGQSHLVLNHEQRCAHVSADGHMYVCLPLLAQGETLGILHILDGVASADKAAEAAMLEKVRLARLLADNIGLGIGNLKMRTTLRNLSIRDPLTGLFNRRYMEEALAQELHRARRNNGQTAVIMIDIDHFKAFNDRYGHDGGDAVLRELGEFFSKHVRGSDVACRYGGEEFMLILSLSTTDGAHQRAERIRKDAEQLDFKRADLKRGAITLSIGVAIFPDHAKDAGALVKAADIALYQAKLDGRNQVVMFKSGSAMEKQL